LTHINYYVNKQKYSSLRRLFYAFTVWYDGSHEQSFETLLFSCL